jgi:hypothetical protein
MWLIIGLIVGVLLFWLGVSLKNAGKQGTWYEWLILVIGVFLLMFSAANYFGSQLEMEPKAANLFLLFVGLPAVILILIAWQLWARRKKTA